MEQSLYSIASDYSFLDSTMAVAIVPIKDFNISEKYVIDGNINIYPEHTLDTSAIQGSIYDFSFQEIKDIFYDATIIAFPIIFFFVIFFNHANFGTVFSYINAITRDLNLILQFIASLLTQGF